MMDTLLVRADAGVAIGTGHVMRCLALAQAWRGRGGQVTFLAALDSPALAERLRQVGMVMRHSVAVPGSPEDVRETLALADRLGASWIVADGYDFDTAFQASIRAGGRSLLLIDDFGHAGQYDADIVLDQNLAADPAWYVHRPAHSGLLLGTTYALLRPEFGVWHDRPRSTPAVARHILITLGGSDPANVTAEILSALRHSLPDDGWLFKVVVGGSNPHAAALERTAWNAAGRIELLQDVADMAELMSWADLSINAGGTTCWELCCLGVPMVIVSLSDNQVGNAASLEAAGAAVAIHDWRPSASDDQLGVVVSALGSDPQRREAMHACGRALVDGCGAERVVEAMIGRWGACDAGN